MLKERLCPQEQFRNLSNINHDRQNYLNQKVANIWFTWGIFPQEISVDAETSILCHAPVSFLVT
jgi:hypothetical protein